MPKTKTLRVTSDVRRDLLAAAAVFKTEASVVWEYVVNGLQYVDRGTAPRVQVTITPRTHSIEISDNGRGMGADDLENFFRMHGENLDRLRGRPGRGKFGTGKSAAFGIAKRLQLETRSGGLRNVVQLTREMIDKSTGDEIPLDWQVRNEATTLPNGTVVRISEILLPRINTPSIIEYIERHLQAFRALGAEVAVNDHICEYRQPTVAEEFSFTPNKTDTLGSIKLTIKVAQAPLPEADQGIAITAGPGNLVAIEKAGIDRKEFGSYLFGEVDAPSLESFATYLEPYDSTRSLSLNPAHPVAAELIPFVGSKLEEVRMKLVMREKEARKSEQARRLAKEAEKIADILNKDFEGVRQRLTAIRTASSTRGPVTSAFGDSQQAGTDGDEWVKGSKVPGELEATGTPGVGKGNGQRKRPNITVSGTPAADGSSSVDPAGGTNAKRTKPRGGFKVDYKNLGRDEPRSVYDPGAFAILINLDHAVVAAALGDGSVEETTFRRLSYEIAFSEYAMALGYEMAKQDPDIPADDLLYEVRSSLNRISVAAASLYR
ncbi:MAG: ATP-binding protein [Gemmatimonadota bacterium]|nr:ATP-binding protein [Gemmatimonadota bacterium]